MRAAESFCGKLTLQVGGAILSVMFLTLVGLIWAVNAFDYHNDLDSMPVNLIVMSVFSILMVITGVVMFFTSYNENKNLAVLSIILGSIILVVWLVIAGLSLANHKTVLQHLCVSERCPESLWLVDLKYRGNWRRMCGDVEYVTTSSSVTENIAGNSEQFDRVAQLKPKPSEVKAKPKPFATTKDLSKTTNKVTSKITSPGPKWPFEEWMKVMKTAKRATLPPKITRIKLKPTKVKPTEVTTEATTPGQKWPFEEWKNVSKTANRATLPPKATTIKPKPTTVNSTEVTTETTTPGSKWPFEEWKNVTKTVNRATLPPKATTIKPKSTTVNSTEVATETTTPGQKWPFEEWKNVTKTANRATLPPKINTIKPKPTTVNSAEVTIETVIPGSKWPFEEWKNVTKIAKRAVLPAKPTQETSETTSPAPNWPFGEWMEIMKTAQNVVLPSEGPISNFHLSRNIRSLENISPANIGVEDPQYKVGLQLAGAIILFIFNLIFFTFTIFIMWSYFKELKSFVSVRDQVTIK